MNPRAFEKARSVVTKGIQISNTAFIKKINSQTGITQRKEQANLNLKNPYFQAYTRLYRRATHRWHTTVQYSNPRMQTCIRDCVEGKLMDGYNFFSQKQEKFQILSNTEASMNQDKRSHTDFKAKTGQGWQKQPTVVWAPQWSHQFCCTGINTL